MNTADPGAVNRRQFIRLTAAMAATGTLAAVASSAPTPAQALKAVAFDALAIFDPRPIFSRVEELFPGRGAELSNVWRSRQFEYTWLRALSGNYADFWQVTGEALAFAAKSLKVELTLANRERLMAGYLELQPWPDVRATLTALQRAGVRMALLSNFTPPMLQACVKASGLTGVFEAQLSTDPVHTYKPDPRAYQLGVDAFKLARQQIAFVAFGSWDAAGARSFGFPTFWVNRQNLPLEELGVTPDATAPTLESLDKFLNLPR